jgi:hypothetical protein
MVVVAELAAIAVPRVTAVGSGGHGRGHGLH